MRQCALGPGRLAAGSRPGKEWAGDRGKRQCWENRGGTEGANEIRDLRDLAARWGQASKGLRPSPPGGTDLSYRVPRGSWLLRVADVTE